MLVFPNCKINIGLNIIEKRTDGYHNIQSVFYPVPLCDALEVIRDPASSGISLTLSGNSIPGALEDNLIVKAYHLIKRAYDLPGLKVHLHKNIPTGAGLGGGSSDVAFFIKMLNEVCDINLAYGEMHYYAKQLGSDCSFFINNKSAYATERGEVLESLLLSLKGYYIVLVKPDIFVSTAEAYSGVKPKMPAKDLESLILQPIETWRDKIVNDFEDSVFQKYPEIKKIKEDLYNQGALYASMSGSGSTVFGIFKEKPDLKNYFENHFYWQSVLE